MENNNMSRMEMIKNKINSLPSGSISPSSHYWCVTCKKFFVLDKPECPYMTGMCINTPIAVENLAPESTEALEKFGLFYPKIPQKILSEIITDNYQETGKNLAQIYLDFIKEWKFDLSKQQPLQTIKSFIIILTGCETAQRINENSVTFVLMDAGKIWDKSKVRDIILGSLEYLKSVLKIEHELNLDFIDILGEREVGKYFCAKCGMFFEFGMKREGVTCPLMSQKCMFDPQHIEKVNYTSDKLVKQFSITPDIYKRFIESIKNKNDFSNKLNEILKDWKITDNQDEIMNKLI
jgi:DNA-directed RNA polymerase subunit RPC12/RpoP